MRPLAVRIAPFAGERAAAISYTFDVNLRDQLTVAVPMLDEIGFKATFFVIAARTADTPEQAATRPTAPATRAWGNISWPELRAMADHGHEIGSHTWTHPNLPRLTPDRVEDQIRRASDAIAAHVGRPPLTLAFPYNASYNASTPAVQAVALKYHVAFRSYQMGTSGKSTVASLNAWADKQVADHAWGVAMIHGVRVGYAAFSDPDVLRQHFRYVKGRDCDVWVDTFANVARYRRERDAAQLRVLESGARSVTCVISAPSLDATVYDVPLTLIVPAAGVTSATATRGGRPLPARFDGRAIDVDAPPSAEAVIIRWR